MFLLHNIPTRICIDNRRRIYWYIISFDTFYAGISKNAFFCFAVVVPFVMLLIPSFVADFSVLSKILGVLPDQLLQISSSINNFNLYQIGDKVIGAIPILFIVYLTGCFILPPLLYRVR